MLKELFGGLLAELRRAEGLALFAKFARGRRCVDVVRVSDSDVRVVFEKPGFINWGIRLTLEYYDRAGNVDRASSVKACAEHEQED